MKIRLVKEPRENGAFLYSTERQLSSGTWCYVSGTCTRNVDEATAYFENILRNGAPEALTVVREAETRTPEEIAAFIAEEDRINGDAK